MADTLDFERGGFDLYFTIPALTEGHSVRVEARGAIYDSRDTDEASPSGYVQIKRTSNVYVFSTLTTDLYYIEQYGTSLSGAGRVRVCAHNKFISIYFDNAWVHTFALDYAFWPLSLDLYMTGSTGITVTDVLRRELSDWQDTVWIDVDMSSYNAFRSVLGRRPVEVWSDYMGKLHFVYTPTRDTVTIDTALVNSYDITVGEDQQAGSDAMVVSADTAVLHDLTYLQNYGFVTRLFRLPEQNNGAPRAVTKWLLTSRQRQTGMYSVDMRYRPEIEPVDILSMSGPGNPGESRSESIIIEDMQIRLANGKATMKIKGRSNTA